MAFASLGSVDFESNIAAQAITMGTSTATGLGTTVYVGAASILTGALLWNVSAGVGYPIFSGLTGLADHGMYAQRFDNGFWYCWNLQNGNLVGRASSIAFHGELSEHMDRRMLTAISTTDNMMASSHTAGRQGK